MNQPLPGTVDGGFTGRTVLEFQRADVRFDFVGRGDHRGNCGLRRLTRLQVLK